MKKNSNHLFHDNFFENKENILNEKKLKLKKLMQNERIDYQNYLQEIKNKKNINNNYYYPENNLENINKNSNIIKQKQFNNEMNDNYFDNINHNKKLENNNINVNYNNPNIYTDSIISDKNISNNFQKNNINLYNNDILNQINNTNIHKYDSYDKKNNNKFINNYSKINFDNYNNNNNLKNIYNYLNTTNKEYENNLINNYQLQINKNNFNNNYYEQIINKNSSINNVKDFEMKNFYNEPSNNLKIPTLTPKSNQNLNYPENYKEKNIINYLDSPNDDDLFRKQKDVENLLKQRKLFEKENKFIQNDDSIDYKKELIYPLSHNLPALEVSPFYKNKSNALNKYKQQIEDKNKIKFEKENNLNEQLTKNYPENIINYKLPFNPYFENKNEFLENKTKNISTYTNLTHTMTMNQSLKNSPNLFNQKKSPEKLYELKEKYDKIKNYKKILDEQIRNRPINSYMCFNNDKRIEVPPNPCKIILFI